MKIVYVTKLILFYYSLAIDEIVPSVSVALKLSPIEISVEDFNLELKEVQVSCNIKFIVNYLFLSCDYLNVC